jgi:zinc transport system substrate-binding protein
VRKLFVSLATLLAFSFVIGLVSGCATGETSKLKVVTSTSLIAQIVERVGGNRVEVVNIIPPAQCPGHFDVKPGDVQQLAKASLFLLHGWQGEKFTQGLIASANNPGLAVVKLDIMGNWMVPSVQQEAVDQITAALSQVDSQNSPTYQESANAYKSKIAAKESEIKARLSKGNLSSVNVMCADQQEGFVRWAGLNVIAVFGRPETLTPQIVKDLVDKGKEKKVALIIDNLQSGQNAGAGIAEELKCKRIILSNFPGGFDNTETWEKAIDRNIELIVRAVAR